MHGNVSPTADEGNVDEPFFFFWKYRKKENKKLWPFFSPPWSQKQQTVCWLAFTGHPEEGFQPLKVMSPQSRKVKRKGKCQASKDLPQRSKSVWKNWRVTAPIIGLNEAFSVPWKWWWVGYFPSPDPFPLPLHPCEIMPVAAFAGHGAGALERIAKDPSKKDATAVENQLENDSSSIKTSTHTPLLFFNLPPLPHPPESSYTPPKPDVYWPHRLTPFPGRV